MSSTTINYIAIFSFLVCATLFAVCAFFACSRSMKKNQVDDADTNPKDGKKRRGKPNRTSIEIIKDAANRNMEMIVMDKERTDMSRGRTDDTVIVNM